MLFKRLKKLSAEDSFLTRQRLQGLIVMLGVCLFYAPCIHLLWDMPPGTKGRQLWLMYAAALPITMIGFAMTGYWVAKESARVIRFHPRLSLSKKGIHGLDISQEPILWRDIKHIAAFSRRPRHMRRQVPENVAVDANEDFVLVLRLTNDAWTAGNIREHQQRMRQSLKKTYGIDGISIDPNRYGMDCFKLLSEIERLRANFG